MKRLFLLTTGLFLTMAGLAQAAPAEQLKIFEQLMAALKGGEQVRVAIHCGRCTLVSGKGAIPAPQAVGGIALGTFEYFAANSIGNSQTLVTFSETALITTRYLRPKDFKVMRPTRSASTEWE